MSGFRPIWLYLDPGNSCVDYSDLAILAILKLLTTPYDTSCVYEYKQSLFNSLL